ncbi:MAG: ABC transporter permease [Victivallaceae bacterium]|nr:ABC transporter permease [Victivallaceae bacterium]
MLHYLLKRCLYSLLVIIGVVLLTFVLFRVAAGDPAAAVLGKNPSPREVEDLRSDLGSDLPLIYGHWHKTEAFSSAGLTLSRGNIEFKRNFTIDGAALQCRIRFRGHCQVNGKEYAAGSRLTAVAVAVSPQQNVLRIADAGGLELVAVEFFRRQQSPFNSQLFCSIREIVTLKPVFPYISFFNFGRTVVTREPIRRILWRGIGPSLGLMVPIFLGELILGTGLALLAAAFRGKWPDRILMLASIAGMSVSYLVFIIAGQWLLGYWLNWFPVWGWGSPINLALPLIIGIASGLGGNMRFYRTVFVNELNRDYLRTAAAKGCSPFTVYTRHLLRNAAIPIITHASAALPFLFTGSLLLETFFGVPGLGYLGVEALNNSDLQLLKALVIISALLFVMINTLADLAYAWADPRIRLK